MTGWIIAGLSFAAAGLIAVASHRAPHRKTVWGNRWGDPDHSICPPWPEPSDGIDGS